MTLSKIFSVYEKQIDIEVTKFDEFLVDEYDDLIASLSQSGRLSSGHALTQKGQLAAKSLEARALMAIRISIQCIDAGGVDLNDQNVSTITNMIKEWLRTQARDLIEKMRNKQTNGHLARNGDPIADTIHKRLNLMFKKVDADYAFLAMQAQTNSKDTSNPVSSAPTINVSGPVGVIQTGNQNTANLSQGINEETLPELIETLKSFSKEISNQDETREVKAAVELAVAELEKPSPNKIVIAGVLSKIKSTVEFVPKLQHFANTLAPYINLFM